MRPMAFESNAGAFVGSFKYGTTFKEERLNLIRPGHLVPLASLSYNELVDLRDFLSDLIVEWLEWPDPVSLGVVP